MFFFHNAKFEPGKKMQAKIRDVYYQELKNDFLEIWGKIGDEKTSFF